MSNPLSVEANMGVQMRPGDTTASSVVRLVGPAQDGATHAGGLQVFGDGTLALDAQSDVHLYSGMGATSGGIVRLSAGWSAVPTAAVVKITDAETDEKHCIFV